MKDFWETFSWQLYLLLEFMSETYWEEIAEEIRDTNPGFMSNKPTHYWLDYGDFNFYNIIIGNTGIFSTLKRLNL